MMEGPVRDALNLPNVRTIRHVVADEQNIYEAQSVEPVGTSCCLLFEVDRSLNGFKPQTYLDTAREGRPSIIHFKVRRWRCRACSTSVYENLSWAARRQGMTARLAAWVFRQATIRSFSQVAAELGIEPKTVARCFMLHAIPAVRKLRLATPRVLGMDEKHLFGGMRAVFGNVEEKTIFWMLKERNRATLTPYRKAIGYAIRNADPGERWPADKYLIDPEWAHLMEWQRRPKSLRLVFFWCEPSNKTGFVAFPFKLDAPGAADFASRWLAEADYGKQPDHDGDNEKGWRAYNESWGHVDDEYAGFIAVSPRWAMYGK